MGFSRASEALLAMGRRFQAEERLQRLRKETVETDGSLVVKFGVFLDGLSWSLRV